VKVETSLVSGIYTWNVYESPAASNSLGQKFHVALGYRTALTSNFVYTVFRDWDATNNVATGFSPARCDSGFGAMSTNYEFTSTGGTHTGVSRPLPDGTNHANIYDFTEGLGNSYGTGTNGTTPPTFSSPLTWTGIVNAPVLVATGIRTATILSGGSGYTTAPTIAFTGGGASTQATATCTVSAGVVTAIQILTPGFGYTSQPTITFNPTSGGTGASAEIRGVAGSYSDWRPVVQLQVSGGYTGGFGISDIALGKQPTQTSGTNYGAYTFNARLNPGFMYREMAVGSTTTDYVYSVTIDRMYWSFRANGTTFIDSYYIGAYDSFMSSLDDPLPLCGVYLGAVNGNTTQIQPLTGYGFSPSEPKLSSITYSSSYPAFCVSPPYSLGVTSGQHYPLLCSHNNNEGYSNRRIPVRFVLNGRGWNGYNTNIWWRGMLKDVYLCQAGISAWQDEIQWTVGATQYNAVKLSSGDGFWGLKV
jgi:flagellin-like hook-associated protein FlgL